MEFQEFRDLLHGRQNGKVLFQKEENIASMNGWTVIYGCSDDLIEFEGYISEEMSQYGSDSLHIVKKKDSLEVLDDYDYNNINQKFEEYNIKLPSVKILFNNNHDDYYWYIYSDVPYLSFDIMEDDEKFCRGIIIDKIDILEHLFTQ